MQPITMLTLICAILVLALLGLAVFTRRAAESARAAGYDQGYDDAKLAAHERATALNHDIARLQELAIATRAQHSQAIEAMILDCDDRIAIYAARALTAEDATLLHCANKQLMPAHPDEWECLAGIELQQRHIKPWPADEARIHYFNRLMELMATTHRAAAA